MAVPRLRALDSEIKRFRPREWRKRTAREEEKWPERSENNRVPFSVLF